MYHDNATTSSGEGIHDSPPRKIGGEDADWTPAHSSSTRSARRSPPDFENRWSEWNPGAGSVVHSPGLWEAKHAWFSLPHENSQQELVNADDEWIKSLTFSSPAHTDERQPSPPPGTPPEHLEYASAVRLQRVLGEAELAHCEGEEAEQRGIIDWEVGSLQHTVLLCVARESAKAAAAEVMGSADADLVRNVALSHLPKVSWDNDSCRIALGIAVAFGAPDLALAVLEKTAFADVHCIKVQTDAAPEGLGAVAFGLLTASTAAGMGFVGFVHECAADISSNFLRLGAACLLGALKVGESVERQAARREVLQVLMSAPQLGTTAEDERALASVVTYAMQQHCGSSRLRTSVNRCVATVNWWGQRLRSVDARCTFQPHASARDCLAAAGLTSHPTPDEAEELLRWTPAGHAFFSIAFRRRATLLALCLKRRGLLRLLVPLLQIMPWSIPLKRCVLSRYPRQTTVVDAIAGGSIESLDASAAVMSQFKHPTQKGSIAPFAGMRVRAEKEGKGVVEGFITGCRYGKGGECVLHWRPTGSVASEAYPGTIDPLPQQPSPAPAPGARWLCGSCSTFPACGHACPLCGLTHMRAMCRERRLQKESKVLTPPPPVPNPAGPAVRVTRAPAEQSREAWMVQFLSTQPGARAKLVQRMNRSARTPGVQNFDAGERVEATYGIRSGARIRSGGVPGVIVGIGLDECLYWQPQSLPPTDVLRLALNPSDLDRKLSSFIH